jgi:hypothetical protein
VFLSQYIFSTRSLPFITDLHNDWYKKIDNKCIKIVPTNIKNIFNEIYLAYWIMDDDYWSENTVFISTDGFAYKEV